MNNVAYLGIEQVIAIHERSITLYGGDPGILDRGKLEAAVHRPMYSIGLMDAYPDIFTKAAALLHSLVLNHCFVDGNKRTGFIAALMFLQVNGYELQATNEEATALVYRVASGAEKDIRNIAAILMLHCIGKGGEEENSPVYDVKVNFDGPAKREKGKLSFTVRPGYLNKEKEVFFYTVSGQPGEPAFRFFKPKQHEDHVELVYQTSEGAIVRKDYHLGPVAPNATSLVDIQFDGPNVDVSIAGKNLSPIVLAEE